MCVEYIVLAMVEMMGMPQTIVSTVVGSAPQHPSCLSLQDSVLHDKKCVQREPELTAVGKVETTTISQKNKCRTKSRNQGTLTIAQASQLMLCAAECCSCLFC